ncbi:hypothetical protein DYL61_01180 [Pseudomonas nabeulensis]|uniref:Uncharacterized protein n=1 Tax=Pseudomonas nabeulensis TaxID=2293833 RepID=A0A4Z0BDQ4_9PSED|nr:hypothetical protein [Pseudomonas nabeulensis]TFY96068.1 hypothetical protein DYL61_01180 [Pseudomonas nabeulensis]
MMLEVPNTDGLMSVSETDELSKLPESTKMASLKNTNSPKEPKAGKKAKKKAKTAVRSVLTEPRSTRRAPRAGSLAAIDVLNALPDVPGGQPGLMSIETLYLVGLRIEIPRWSPGGGGPFARYGLEIRINNSLVGPREDLGPNLNAPELVWPRPYTFNQAQLGDHGLKNLTYEVFHGTTSDSSLRAAVVTVDRYDTHARIRPARATLPAWVVNGKVTVELLDVSTNLLTVTCSPRFDPQVGDRLSIFWHYTDPTPIATVTDLPVNNSPVSVTLDKADILAMESGVYQLAYIYYDRAGNETTFPPYLTEITLTREPSPANLQPPVVPEAPLDREDAQLNRAYVRITGYDNVEIGQQIVVNFNGRMIYATVNNLTFPKDIPIPWADLASGGEDAPYTAMVFYAIIANGTASPTSSSISVPVDLTAPGLTPDPGGPGPVNPNLGRLTITSAGGLTNEIGPGDTGNATATFAVYTGAVAGDRIQIYWKGIPALTPPYTVTVADETAPQFSIPVPASVIALGGDGVHDVLYSLNNGTNNNFIDSLPTPVDVKPSPLVDLELLQYPDAQGTGADEDPFFINCDNGITSGIKTKIISPGKLKAGDQVTLVWVIYGPDDFYSSVVVLEHEFPPVTVTLDHFSGHPGEIFTVPFATYISPVTQGRVEAYYKVLRPSGAPGESEPSLLYVSRYLLGGGVCG